MWMILGACAAAVAGPGLGLAAGAGPVSSQAAVRVSFEPAGEVTWGVQGTLATSGPLMAEPEWFLRDQGPGEMLVQPLLGPTIDVGLSDVAYLGFGVGFDLLAPLRAARDVAALDPDGASPGLSWGLVFPASLVGNALAMSQFKVAVGARPVDAVAVEVGLWPSTGRLGSWFDPSWLEPGGAMALLTAVRPGAQVIAHF